MKTSLLLGGLLVWSVLGCLRAAAQAPAWQLAVTAPNASATAYSECLTLTTDAAGNVYLVGAFTGSVIFGGTTLTAAGGTTDSYVAKWSPQTRNFAWAVRLGGAGFCAPYGVAVNGGSVYVAGYFTGATLTAGSTVLPNAGNGTQDVFVARINDAGTSASFAWAQRAGGPGDDACDGLSSNGGTLYLSGYLSGSSATFGTTILASAGGHDGFVARLRDGGTTGTFDWAVRLGGVQDDEAIRLLASGNQLYVAGTFAGTAAFGNGSLTSLGSSDVFVAKLTDLGSTAVFGWTLRLGGTNYEIPLDLAQQGSSVYVAGGFTSASFTAGTQSLNNAGNYDGFLVKLSDAGPTVGVAWATALGGGQNDVAWRVAVRGGYLYASGYFGSNANATPTAPATFGSYVLTPGGGNDLFAARLTEATGTFNWVLPAGSSLNDVGIGLGIAGSSVYVAGYFSGTLIQFGNTTLVNARPGAGATYLASFTDLALPAREPAALASVGIFPNPAPGAATVRVPAGAGPATVQVLDALGRVVRQALVSAGQDYPLGGLAPGVYAVRVQVGEATAVQRLTVE